MEREQDGSLRIGGKIPDARPRRFSFLSCCKPEKENEQEEEEEVEAFETPFMPGGTAEIQAGSSTLPYLLSHIRRARTRAIARAALQACILSFNMDTDRQLSTTLFSTFILFPQQGTRSEAAPYLVPQAQSEPVVLEGIGPATADKRPSEFQELRVSLIAITLVLVLAFSFKNRPHSPFYYNTHIAIRNPSKYCGRLISSFYGNVVYSQRSAVYGG